MTKNENTEAILDKIAKLRKLATSSNVNEAAAAAAMVQKLVEKYSLQDALLQVDTEKKTGQRQDEEIIKDVIYEFKGPRVQTYTLELAAVICRNNGVKCYYTSGHAPSKLPGRIWGAGTKEDLEVVKALLLWLEAEVERLYKEHRPKGEARKGMTKGNAKSWGFSFRNGAVVTIGERLWQARLEARRLLEDKAKVEDAYQLALKEPEKLLLLDGMMSKVNKDEALTQDERIVVERMLPTTPQRYALARVTCAIEIVQQKQVRSDEWTRKNVGLRAGPVRPTVGKSDKCRGSQAQTDAFVEGKRAGHKVRLNPKKES